jgi:hypothetical protein
MLGVAGSTLTELCGDREAFPKGTEEWTEFVVDDVEDALEWDGRW